jgi:hypothetical protein
VVRLVVGLAVLPYLPDDGQPAIGQPAVCIGVRATAGTEIAPVGQSPARLPHGGFGKLLGYAPELAIAAATEDDDLALTALLGDGAGTGQSLNAGRSGEAIAVVTELGQQSRSQKLAGTGQGIEEEGIGMLGEKLSQGREGLRATEYLRQEQFGQDADLVTIGCYGDRVGFWSRFHQVSVTPRDEVDPAIAMFSTESLKSSSSQALGFLGSGKGHQEVEVDLSGEFPE